MPELLGFAFKMRSHLKSFCFEDCAIFISHRSCLSRSILYFDLRLFPSFQCWLYVKLHLLMLVKSNSFVTTRLHRRLIMSDGVSSHSQKSSAVTTLRNVVVISGALSYSNKTMRLIQTMACLTECLWSDTSQ